MPKPPKWKAIPLDGVPQFLATSSKGDFVVYGHQQQLLKDVRTMAVTVHHKNGETISIAVPGLLGGLTVTLDDRIIAAISESWPASGQHDYRASGFVVMKPSGELLGGAADPSLAGASVVKVDASGTRLAAVLAPMKVGHPDYLGGKVVLTTVDDVMAGRVPTPVLTFKQQVPTIAFELNGALRVLVNGEMTTVSTDGTTRTEAMPPDSGFHSPASALMPFDPNRLMFAGGRMLAMGYHDQLTVYEAGAPIFGLAPRVATHAVLSDDGKTLVALANPAKHRMGGALENQTAWPDPQMVGAYIAAWNLDEKKLVKVIPRKAGYAAHVVYAAGEFVAVLGPAPTKTKIEFFPWSDLTT